MAPAPPPASEEAWLEALHDETIDGRYRLVRLLGKGGMGAVFEAESLRTDVRVAVKVMFANEGAGSEALRRFDREAKAPSRIHHPSIVPVSDAGYDPRHQVHFIVQEMLVGETLTQRLRREGRLGLEAALAIVHPVMEALAAAHAQKIIHRDVKPSNIFLHEDVQGVRPRVIDFGIAKVVNTTEGSDERTRPGVQMGSPKYMAPEQVLGATSDIDARTDVWSVGVLLYEMLSGANPFAARSVTEIFHNVLGSTPRPLAELGLGVPEPLSRAVAQAMEKQQNARFPDMTTFMLALRQGAVPSREIAPGAASRTLSTFGYKAPAPPFDNAAVTFTGSVSPMTLAPRPASRSRLAALGGALVLIALSAIAGWVRRDASGDRGPAPGPGPLRASTSRPTDQATPALPMAPAPASSPVLQVLAPPAAAPALVPPPNVSQREHTPRRRARPTPRRTSDPWAIDER